MPDFRFCPQCRTELVTGERGGRERRLCPACEFVAWDNPIPVVAGIVERDGGVVLVRNHGHPPTWFGLVAGFLEAGETPREGIAREVAEEIGIGAVVTELVGVYPFAMRNQIIFVYHVDGEGGEIRLCPDEIAEYRLVPIGELKPWSRGTGPGLRDWLAARGYSPPTVDFGQHVSE